jgi:uncharacterized protein DUF5348
MRDTRFIYNYNHKQLELEGKLIASGDLIEVCVLGHWIQGYVSLDSTGWYLLTHDRVGIRLQPGILARFPREMPLIDLSSNGDHPPFSSP